MSDLFDRVAMTALGSPSACHARRRSRFEPLVDGGGAFAATGSVGLDDRPDEERSVQRTTRAQAAPARSPIERGGSELPEARSMASDGPSRFDTSAAASSAQSAAPLDHSEAPPADTIALRGADRSGEPLLFEARQPIGWPALDPQPAGEQRAGGKAQPSPADAADQQSRTTSPAMRRSIEIAAVTLEQIANQQHALSPSTPPQDRPDGPLLANARQLGDRPRADEGEGRPKSPEPAREPREPPVFADPLQAHAREIVREIIAREPRRTTAPMPAPSPTVEVTIGRLEIRAGGSATAPPAKPRKPFAPHVDLAAYRDRRERRE